MRKRSSLSEHPSYIVDHFLLDREAAAICTGSVCGVCRMSGEKTVGESSYANYRSENNL